MKDYVPILFVNFLSLIVVYASDSGTCIKKPSTHSLAGCDNIAKNGYCNKYEETTFTIPDNITRGQHNFLQMVVPMRQLVRNDNLQNICKKYSSRILCKYPYGVVKNTFKKLVKSELYDTGYINNYDLRLFNTTCPSIIEISDQGSCDSCWAVAVTDVITDRLCLKSKGRNKARYSVMDLMSCCEKCSMDKTKPCTVGGIHEQAWLHWTTTGIVSGHYNTNERKGCKNYHVDPCSHVEEKMGNSGETSKKCVSPTIRCPPIEHEPTCKQVCDDDWTGKSYEQDKMKGKDYYTLTREFDGVEEAIKLEIILHGPVHATMTVYHSFHSLFSSNNVHEVRPYLAKYNDTEDTYCRGHAIRIVGWGKKDNRSYWIAANTWGEQWGDNGFFYLDFEHDKDLKKGKDEIFAGIPEL